MLLRDIDAYRQIWQGYRHALVDDTFELLRDIANLFALPPENIAGFVHDGRLASVPKPQLLDLIKRRWDYKTQGDKLQL